jgi:hypothetical protein
MGHTSEVSSVAFSPDEGRNNTTSANAASFSGPKENTVEHLARVRLLVLITLYPQFTSLPEHAARHSPDKSRTI